MDIIKVILLSTWKKELFQVMSFLSIYALILFCPPSLHCCARILPHVTLGFLQVSFDTIYEFLKFLSCRE